MVQGGIVLVQAGAVQYRWTPCMYLEREFVSDGEMLTEHWSVPHNRGEADGTEEVASMLPPIWVLSPERTGSDQ